MPEQTTPHTMLDPVTLAVLRGRLEQIADEMDATLYRSAFNPIIAEAHDACHGLYDADSGDTLVQGKSGLPVFVGAMAFAVRAAAQAAAGRGCGASTADCLTGKSSTLIRLGTPTLRIVQRTSRRAGQAFSCARMVSAWRP